MSVAIYSVGNVQLFTQTLSAYTATTFAFTVPSLLLTGDSYYYFAVFSTAANMYSGTSVGATIVNSSLNSFIQYARVAYTGTTLPSALPIGGGVITSFIYPPFNLVGYWKTL